MEMLGKMPRWPFSHWRINLDTGSKWPCYSPDQPEDGDSSSTLSQNLAGSQVPVFRLPPLWDLGRWREVRDHCGLTDGRLNQDLLQANRCSKLTHSFQDNAYCESLILTVSHLYIWEFPTVPQVGVDENTTVFNRLSVKKVIEMVRTL